MNSGSSIQKLPKIEIQAGIDKLINIKYEELLNYILTLLMMKGSLIKILNFY